MPNSCAYCATLCSTFRLLGTDQLIGGGDTLYAEIADRLDYTKVAIVLVTPEFLRSRICLLEEISVLLLRAMM